MEQRLREVVNNAYAPYSNFKVGAILEMENGEKYIGVNVENASYGATICAERSAIVNAIANGFKKGDFKRLSIMNSSDKIATPCMVCRQLFVEFFDMDMEVVCYDINGNSITYKVSDLCPVAFSKENL